MTLRNREGYLGDLSRWNRAGLTRFQYVDGDAAVWLEELRIALLGYYLRGIDPDDRTPEKWRDLFLKIPTERQLKSTETEYEAAVIWKDLLPAFPAKVETGDKRNQRLLEQYDRHSRDYAWEIARAFAKAAHITLGHQNAYANEGYLRTATQWDNLRKLAAMVNYQPGPPASATTTIALELEKGRGVIEIARGLAMKHTPPAGGAPLIFETLKNTFMHPELNAARAKEWNLNNEILSFKTSSMWIAPKKANLATGDPAILTNDESSGQARSLKVLERNLKDETAELAFDREPTLSVLKKDAVLLTEPDGIQLGLPRTSGSQVVIKMEGASAYSVGTLLRLNYTTDAGNDWLHAEVTDSSRGYLKLSIDSLLSDEMSQSRADVTIEAYTPFIANIDGDIETPLDIHELYYKRTSGTGKLVEPETSSQVRREDPDDVTSKEIANIHNSPDYASGPAYVRMIGGKNDRGRMIKDLTLDGWTADNTVRFEGKPPKSLKQGDWYAARPVGTSDLTAHEVLTIRVEAGCYFLQFSPTPLAPHDRTEFLGPMTRRLRPADYDRGQDDAITGGIATLQGLSPEARDLVKAGRDIIVVDDKVKPPRSAEARVTAVEPLALDYKLLRIELKSDQDFSDWRSGWTKFHLNTVDVSQGETKDSKILGSGDAEKRRQNFNFKIKDISFIPSNASVTGVTPDMDVTVDGVKWAFRDITDPIAEGENAWSVALNEDDTLQIHFRRRLNTGTDNIAVSRHRVGSGAKGTGVPSWSITKPMKKNRYVTGIIQPFVTSGGAEREPVSDIRKNAPSKLAANGRAVSLRDFERLCRRHSSVWQAKALEVAGPGSDNQINIIIVPANGGTAGSKLEKDLADFVENRTLPNTRVSISDYQPLPLRMDVKIRVNTDQYEKADVKDATEAALVEEFALIRRGLGQPVYIAEILAAMERVEGVTAATITRFSTKPGAPAPLREAEISESLAAIFTKDEQVAVIDSVSDVTVDVVVLK